VPDSKPIAGSKPQPTYFFYVQNHREHFASTVNKDGTKLKGLELSRAINAVASDAWSNLSDEEKQSWKQKAIESWEISGGPERARLEEARKAMLATNRHKSLNEAAVLMEKQLEAAFAQEKKDAVNKKSNAFNTSTTYGKDITFEAADAEGYSAMEQRIQQLAQSLSRVGRVLDRHRENYIVKEDGTEVNSEFLRNLVHTPLSIMSDEEVVKWMWGDTKGVVHTVLDMMIQHFPHDSTLRYRFSAIMENYNILSLFCERYNSSIEIKKRNDSTTPSVARGLLRDALHDFRATIIEFLTLTESSFVQSSRKKKSKKKSKSKKQILSAVDPPPAQEDIDFAVSKGDTVLESNQRELEGDDEVMRIIGGGEEGVAAMDSGSEQSTLQESLVNNPEIVLTLENSIESGPCKEDELRDCAKKKFVGRLDAGIAPLENNASIRVKNVVTTGITRSENFGGTMENIPRQQKKELKPTSDELSVITPSTTETQENDEGLKCNDDEVTSGGHRDSNEAVSSQLSCGNSEKATPSSSKSQEYEVARKPSKNSEGGLENQIHSMSTPDHYKSISGSKPQPTYFYFLQSKRDHFISMVNEKENALGVHISTAINELASRAWADLGEAEKESWKQKAHEDWVRNGGLEKARLEEERKHLVGEKDALVKEGKEKKKPEPFPPETVKYLTDWVLNPEHILNPYPSAEEKDTIGKDLGLERRQIDGWLSSHRRRLIMPQKQLKKMELSETDIDHWSNFRKYRYMLETTADLLLMYACTNTFFVLKPFIRFDSTPIEVYARELGNNVPRHLSFDSRHNWTQNVMNSDLDHSKQVKICGNEKRNEDKNNESSPSGVYPPDHLQTEIPPPKDCCSPDDVITTVTVNYSGDYVLTQLLQWFTGGIGQKQGLPDMFGCVMLPPVHGCWDIIDDCEEIKSSSDPLGVTEYKAKIQPRLAEWFDDRTQRGSPWERDIARYFCPKNASAPDPTMPMGSPILDYLVTGNNENIIRAANALRRISAERVEHLCQEVSTKSASDRLKSTVDYGMPAQAIANWVQCENPCCLKWRKLPWHVDVDLLPEKFFCKDNVWNKKSSTCAAPEDEWDMDDAPIKFDTNETSFDIGAWFDVRREGKVGYSEAQVVKLDFNSNVKRVKFHFYKTKSEMDEWIEVGSPRIAPHHSYTPTYPGGKLEVSKKKSKSYSGATKKKKKKGNESIADESNVMACAEMTSLHPSSKKRKKITDFKPKKKGKNKRELMSSQTNDDQLLHPTKSKGSVFNEHENITHVMKTEEALETSRDSPKKRKKTHDEHTESTVNARDGDKLSGEMPQEMKIYDTAQRRSNEEQSPGPNKKSTSKSAKFSQEIYDYLNAWVAKNPTVPVPSPQEKATIMNDTGLERRQLSDWLHRARRKKKRNEVITAEACRKIPDTATTSLFLHSKNAMPSIGTQLSSTEIVSRMDNTESEVPKQQPNQVNFEGNVASLNCSATEVVAQNDNIETKVNEDDSGILESSSSATVSVFQEKGLPKSAKLYLEQWISIPEHAAYPYPSREEKDAIISQFAIEDKRQLDAWFSNARRNMKKKMEKSTSTSSTVTIEKLEPQSGRAKFEDSNPSADSELGEFSNDKEGPESEVPKKVISKDVVHYLTNWMMSQPNPLEPPTSVQKVTLMAETGLEKRRLENWFYRARKKIKKSKERACESDPHLYENVTKSVVTSEKSGRNVTTCMDQNILDSNSTHENTTSSRVDKPVHLSNIDALLDAARLDSLYEEQNHLAVISSRIEHPSQSCSSNENMKKNVEGPNASTGNQSYRVQIHDTASSHSRSMDDVAPSSHHLHFNDDHHPNPHRKDSLVNLSKNPQHTDLLPHNSEQASSQHAIAEETYLHHSCHASAVEREEQQYFDNNQSLLQYEHRPYPYTHNTSHVDGHHFPRRPTQTPHSHHRQSVSDTGRTPSYYDVHERTPRSSHSYEHHEANITHNYPPKYSPISSTEHHAVRTSNPYPHNYDERQQGCSPEQYGQQLTHAVGSSARLYYPPTSRPQLNNQQHNHANNTAQTPVYMSNHNQTSSAQYYSHNRPS